MAESDFCLRLFKFDDAEEILAAVQESQPELSRWMPHLNHDLSLDEIRLWILNQKQAEPSENGYHFAIVHEPDGRLVGGCGLTQFNLHHRFANLYYWVRASASGQGAATAGVRILVKRGFALYNLQRIEVVMAVENSASEQVARKTGAVYEGRMRSRLFLNGEVHDAYLFSLLPGDLIVS